WGAGPRPRPPASGANGPATTLPWAASAPRQACSRRWTYPPWSAARAPSTRPTSPTSSSALTSLSAASTCSTGWYRGSATDWYRPRRGAVRAIESRYTGASRGNRPGEVAPVMLNPTSIMARDLGDYLAENYLRYFSNRNPE